MQVLTQASIMYNCPSAYAVEPAEHLSNKYQYVNTAEVMRQFQTHGFYPVAASQRGKGEHASHIIRLRHRDDIWEPKPECFDILLINSHNGTVSFQLRFGIFRLVCSNGMVVGTALCDSVKFKHLRSYNALIKEAVNTFNLEVEKIQSAVDRMKTIELSSAQIGELALAGATARWGAFEKLPKKTSTIGLAFGRRSEDFGSNLWLTYNRIQENLIKGQRGNGVRELRDWQRGVKVNSALWDKAMQMAA